jgi:hypothetical protein
MMTAAAAMVACSGGGSGSDAVERGDGIPIRASEVHGAGTRLPDVFVVPSGAVLAGAALPRPRPVSNGRRTSEREWTAVLGVGVAPRVVAIALLSQARAAGLQRLPAEPSCDHIACAFDNFGLVPQAGRVVVVRVGAQANAGTFAFVRFDEFPGLPNPGPPASGGTGTTGVPPTPRAPARGVLPATGDPIRLGDWTATVAEGTTLVMPSVDADGPQEAILRVTGDPEDAYRAYVRQLRVRTADLAPRRVPDTKIDGWTIKTTGDGEFGSRTVELLTRHGRSYIRLTGVND